MVVRKTRSLAAQIWCSTSKLSGHLLSLQQDSSCTLQLQGERVCPRCDLLGTDLILPTIQHSGVYWVFRAILPRRSLTPLMQRGKGRQTVVMLIRSGRKSSPLFYFQIIADRYFIKEEEFLCRSLLCAVIGISPPPLPLSLFLKADIHDIFLYPSFECELKREVS